MWSIVRRFGVIALAVVAAWLLTVIVLNLTVYSPARTVQLYLNDLEAGNFGVAATAAGLASVPAVVPEPSGSVTEPRVIGTRTISTGGVIVLAEYEIGGETSTSFFTLEPREPTLWLFNDWRFSESPTATLSYAVVGDERVDVNGVRLDITRLGVPPTSRVFVPGAYQASLTTPWVVAPVDEVRATQLGDRYPLRLRVEATNELKDSASTAVESYLDGCVSQVILQPVGCPFGVTISDRVVGTPEWVVLDYPVVSLTLGGDRSSWNVLAIGGVVEVTVSVQSLFDGSVSEYSEIVSFLMEGAIRGTPVDEPVLNL